MKLDTFFEKHQIFDTQELSLFLKGDACPKERTSTVYNMLTYHQKRGRIFRIRRKLYYSVPKGRSSTTYPVDPFLVASKMANDAVLGYRTALDLQGCLHSVTNEFIYISEKREMYPFIYKNVKYRGV